MEPTLNEYIFETENVGSQGLSAIVCLCGEWSKVQFTLNVLIICSMMLELLFILE